MHPQRQKWHDASPIIEEASAMTLNKPNDMNQRHNLTASKGVSDE